MSNAGASNNGLAAYAAIKAAGFPDIQTALQVAYAESGWNQSARNRNSNGSTDYGLFQINSIHNPSAAVKTDMLANAKFAKSLYDKQGWRPWVAYKTGAYKKADAVKKTAEVMKAAKDKGSDFDWGKALQVGGLHGAVGYEESNNQVLDASLGGVATGMGDAIAAANPLNIVDTVKAALDGYIQWAREALSIILMVLIGLALFALGVYAAFHDQINAAAGKAVGGVANLVVGKKAKAAGKIIGAVTK